MQRAGDLIALVVAVIGGGILVYFHASLPLFVFPLTFVILLIITGIIRFFGDQPVIVFQTSEYDAERIKTVFDAKINLSAYIAQTEGNTSFLVDDRSKHLAVSGYYFDDEEFVLWIFGKKSYTTEISDYMNNSVEFKN